MRKLWAWLLLAFWLAGCGTPGPPDDACSGLTRADFPTVPAAHSVVALATNDGCMVVQLYDGDVPVTAANFKRYVEEGFYTDLTWHRILPGFLSQTGQLRRNGAEQPPTHPLIPNESGLALGAGLHNDLYTFAMVYVPGDYDSAATQFFINMARGDHGHESRYLDATNATTNDGYCVFATLVSGTKVADRINNNTSTVDPPVLVAARLLA